jgi:hypothetical protein
MYVDTCIQSRVTLQYISWAIYHGGTLPCHMVHLSCLWRLVYSPERHLPCPQIPLPYDERHFPYSLTCLQYLGRHICYHVSSYIYKVHIHVYVYNGIEGNVQFSGGHLPCPWTLLTYLGILISCPNILYHTMGDLYHVIWELLPGAMIHVPCLQGQFYYVHVLFYYVMGNIYHVQGDLSCFYHVWDLIACPWILLPCIGNIYHI